MNCYKIGEIDLNSYIKKSKKRPTTLHLNMVLPLPNVDSYYGPTSHRKISSMEDFTAFWDYLREEFLRENIHERIQIPRSLAFLGNGKHWYHTMHLIKAKKDKLDEFVRLYDIQGGEVLFSVQLKLDQFVLYPVIESWCKALDIALESAITYLASKFMRNMELLTAIHKIKMDRSSHTTIQMDRSSASSKFMSNYASSG